MNPEIDSAGDSLREAITLVNDYRQTFELTSIASATIEHVLWLLLNVQRQLDSEAGGKKVAANS